MIAVKESTSNPFKTIKNCRDYKVQNDIRHKKILNEDILHNGCLANKNYPKRQVQRYYLMTYEVHGFNVYKNSPCRKVHCVN